MKVLVCIPCLLTGGTEIQTLSLVEALVAAGHQPVVACYFEYNPEMVERYKKTGTDVWLISPNGIRPSGIKNMAVFLWKGLKNVIKSVKPDVVHIQYMAPGALAVIILKLLGVKYIIATAHTSGDIYGQNGLRVVRLLSKYVLCAFQCITELAEISYFGSSNIFDGKLTKHFTIYNNIPSHIQILESIRCKNDINNTTVGVVSRLEPIKGMDLVIPAFAKAYAKNQTLRLLIVGDGSQRELMSKQAHYYDIVDKVTFAGLKAQIELQDMYDHIDILLMPSRSEGFGLTAIEGMARGCVPVVSNTGGLPEVVNSECGFLHRVDDTSDIADKILLAAKNLSQLSNSAVKRAAIFSTQNYYRQIKSLYSQKIWH